MSRSLRSHEHRCPNSKPTRNVWAGASNGCHRRATISTSTITSHSPKRKSRRTRFTTTTRRGEFVSDELPGLSVFYKDENGDVFHTYSAYARGLDHLVGTYNFLDLVPKGRDENPDSTMDWVRRHDEYLA